MCLDTIERKIKKPTKRAVKAWKAVTERADGGYDFWYMKYRGSEYMPRGEWLTAEEVPVGTLSSSGNMIGRYISGFHAFLTKDDVIEFGEEAAIPVRVRYVHTIGRQKGMKVLVAREMYVPKPRVRKEK